MLKLKGLTGKGYRRLAQTVDANSRVIADNQISVIQTFIDDLINEVALDEDYANMRPPNFDPLDDLHMLVLKWAQDLDDIMYKEYN